MQTIKGLLLITLLAFFTSCGKGEPIGDIGRVAKKATVDTINTVAKASIDTLKTVKKAVDDTLREGGEVASKVGEAGEQIVEGSDDLVNGAGKLVEKVGQIPRNLGNALLGTDSSTDEDLKDLQYEVDALRAEMRASFYNASQDLNSVSNELRQADSNLSQRIDDAIQTAHTELAEEVSTLEQRIARDEFIAVMTYVQVNRKINDLRRNLRSLRNYVNNLEVMCEADIEYAFFGFMVENIEVACEL